MVGENEGEGGSIRLIRPIRLRLGLGREININLRRRVGEGRRIEVGKMNNLFGKKVK